MELAAGMKWMKRVALEPEPLTAGPGPGPAGATDYYDGSRVFTWVAELAGLPIDQVIVTGLCRARGRLHLAKPGPARTLRPSWPAAWGRAASAALV